MMPLGKTLSAVLCVATVAFAGCEQKGANEPKAVSIDQGSSAQRYPAMLEHENKFIRDSEARGKEKIAKLPTAADKISDTDWAIVEQVVDAADSAGKDGGYAATMRELRPARSFFEEEREPIVKKVGGSANYAAKQKGCEADLWGPVNQGLKDGVDDAMRDRLRASNDAFILIERHKEALGKKNIPALEEMADDIAETSYVVNVEMPEAKQRLEAVASGASDARSALNSFIADEKKFQEDPKRKPEEKQASDARIKKAEEQLKALEAQEQATQENLKDLEQRAKDLESQYDDALKKLKDAIAAKKPK